MKSKTEEDGSYQTLKLAMKTDEKRKARLEKMVATTQLSLALDTEEERRALDFFLIQGMSPLAL